MARRRRRKATFAELMVGTIIVLSWYALGIAEKVGEIILHGLRNVAKFMCQKVLPCLFDIVMLCVTIFVCGAVYYGFIHILIYGIR